MMPTRVGLATMAAILALTACTETRPGLEESESVEVDETTEVATSGATEAQLAVGRQVYDDVCSECHSLQPPPDLAPPLTHIARRLRTELEERPAFIEHVVSHIPDPTEERSLLPAHAIERFGLMPAQALSAEQLDGVAAWLWVMADSAKSGREMMGEEGGMGGMGQQRGMQGGGGMGGGMHGEGGMGSRGGMGMSGDTTGASSAADTTGGSR